MLNFIQRHDEENLVGIIGYAIELTETIVRHYPEPFDPVLVTEVFPALVNMMMTSIDDAALQNGCDLLRAFVGSAMDQIVAFNNGQTSGLEFLIQVWHTRSFLPFVAIPFSLWCVCVCVCVCVCLRRDGANKSSEVGHVADMYRVCVTCTLGACL